MQLNNGLLSFLPSPYIQDLYPTLILTILNTVIKQASLQKALLDQYQESKAGAIRALGGRSRNAEIQRIRPEKQLKKRYKWDTMPPGSILHTKNNYK